LKVLEIGYGVAAPVACRNLGEFGAEVIKIESVRRPDSLRTVGAGWVPPEAAWELRRDTGLALDFTCPGKRSVGLELEGAGRDAFLRLVASADVLIMNLSVDAVAELGLTHAELRQVNPGLISMNMAAFGASEGPYRTYRTWGANLSGLAGLTELVGWPDLDPVGMPISFPDYVSALWGTFAVVAAIMRRDVTGEGCEIDLAQYQVAIACIGPTVTSVGLGGPAPRASGNRLSGCAPHGVYPTRAVERWVAVSVMDEHDWDALGDVEGLESMVGDARFASLALRLEHEDELDAELARWTSTRDQWEVASELQRAGVAAAPVMDSWAVLADTQLAARDFFRVLPSTRFGAELSYGQAVMLSDSERAFTRAAPAFGEHTREVLAEVGLTAGEIDTLVDDGVAHEMFRPELELERPFSHWIAHLMPLAWPAATIDPGRIVFDRLAVMSTPPAAETET
jgi:crotonobetainyl-CoA:carnitine CoA-transferase CaiB-like acyl-CoA transferase